ncbi:hypothetical protein ATANTOWER_021980 [Ataeniobius toweri]|uniref:Uncharacterized protein n=1 Tax=Ataeniobius toweri TaxID=208326 RepID=A0ABU7AV50_9TELE|nr:hypothetical protein [Ataeniobius toweri]
MEDPGMQTSRQHDGTGLTVYSSCEALSLGNLHLRQTGIYITLMMSPHLPPLPAFMVTSLQPMCIDS